MILLILLFPHWRVTEEEEERKRQNPWTKFTAFCAEKCFTADIAFIAFSRTLSDRL